MTDEMDPFNLLIVPSLLRTWMIKFSLMNLTLDVLFSFFLCF